ncbi:reverse transcriptase domain-containing protein [Trichonephila clavipes]|nr:reverse transcriptase domain-containing protein [Trichonephila clavipes]
MDDIKKLKKIRAVTRTAVTKVMNKLEKEFDSQSIDLLQEHFDYLNEHLKQFRELDNKIQNIIQVEDEFDAEIQSAFGYNEKISVLCSKIKIQIKTLTKSDPSVSSQATVNVQNDSFNNSINGSSVNSNKNVNSVRLPKLQIHKYFGDPCLWLEFWNKFQNSIDKNETLTKVDKFSYLKSLLGGAAGNVVNGFALSDDNYDNALILLKEIFGREGIVVNAHMSKLLNLYPVKDSNNVIGLRKLYDICKIQIRSLESLNVTSGMYGHLLQPILLKLLPEDLVLDFNRKQLGKKEESTFDVMELLQFLKIEIECRESANLLSGSKGERKKLIPHNSKHMQIVSGDNQNISRSRQNKNHIPLNSNSSRTFEYFTPVIEKKCIYCDSDKHGSELCDDLSVDEKKEILRKQGRCFLCLEKNHRIRDCKKKEMCKCNKKHNQSLCFQSVRKTRDLDVENNVVSAVSHCNYNIKNKEPEVKNAECSVLLQTCTSCVRSPLDDKLETVRLLLDNGSMRSFITREISRQLKLPVVRKETLSVYSFGAKQATEKTYNVVKVIIENRDEPTLNIEIEALETDQITATNIPVPSNNISKINKQLKGLKLADCYEFRNNKIVILVGADYYYGVVLNRIKRLNDKLVATETLFGWCILGKTEMTNTILGMKIVVGEKLISDDLTKFWELENLGIEANATENISDDVTLKEFESGISFSDNRYSVRLPWKPGMKEQLQDNRTVALKRFRGLQSKFLNDPFLFNEYRAVLEEHKSENIIESVTNELKEDKTIFYLPHTAVIREDKTTIKFRENRVAFTADIKQAFLQIQLDEEDRDVTRFLWNENPDGPEELIQNYRMTRMLFGVSSSPFLLAATIKHHLKRYVEKFPETCEMLNNSLYVDDLISGRENVEQAFKTSLESVDIFKGASTILRKWQTNSPELRDRWIEIGMDIGQSVESKTQTLAPSKILGVAWNPDQDTFYFDTGGIIKFLKKRTNTKRCLLQAAGRIFDPVGFLSPFIIRLKILIQELWCLGLDWDEFFPKNLESSWNEWCEEVPELNTFSIPRYYLGYALQNETDNIQIHCFSDSSKNAYGTVVNLRIALKNEKTFTNFVASKCRVAPLKQFR